MVHGKNWGMTLRKNRDENPDILLPVQTWIGEIFGSWEELGDDLKKKS